MAQENVNSNDVSELSRLSSQELETQLQQAVKDKDQKRVMEIFAEQNKRNPDTVMVEENKSILEKYKAFMEKYHKEGNFGDKRDEFVKFFQNDIKTYKSNMETQHTNLEDARNKQLSTLMGLLDEKDTQIADLTKERDEALNVLPKAGEIFWPGRRMNKLFENIKELQEGHANSYPENALRLLMVQSTTQHLGLRKLGARMKMGFGKEMNGFSKRLFRLHKADIYKHLEDILTKVDDQERNGKGVWTKNQAKRLKAKIKEVQDAYVEKEKNKIQWYVFGNTNRRAA